MAEDWVPWKVGELSSCAFALLHIALGELFPFCCHDKTWNESEVAAIIITIGFICSGKEFRKVTVSAFTGLVEGLQKQLLSTPCAHLPQGLNLLLSSVAVGVLSHSESVTCILSSSFLPLSLCWEPFKVGRV